MFNKRTYLTKYLLNKMSNLIVWSYSFLMLLTLIKGNDGTVVQVSNGKIRGRILTNFRNKDYYAFEGIPYAIPPTGQNRFKEPMEPENWNGTLQTTNNKKKCIQIFILLKDGTEDCLYLNVYTPTNPISENQSLPVLVYIHEGGFQKGSSASAKPGYFMDYGVILVGINYRLGPFGFLTTADGVIPGNLGLKDQRLALKWVSKNINKFGGDPEKITISGQSAGSVSVSLHLLALQNKGLFRGAVLESGSALCHHDFQPNPRKFAFELGKLINPSFSGDSQELLRILKQLTAGQLVTVANFLTFKYISPNEPAALILLKNIWLPVIENPNETAALITVPMHQAFMEGRFLKVPILAGFNSEEAIFFPDFWLDFPRGYQIDQSPEVLINKKLNVNDTINAGIELKTIYTDSFSNNPGKILQYLSDNYYTTPVLRQADLALVHTPVYLYQFSYSISTSLKPRIQGADNVGHTAELTFIFGDREFLNKNDNLTHQRMMNLWSNFIKYQNPTPINDDILITWPKATAKLDCYNINKTLSVFQNPKRYIGWRTVLEKYIQKPYNVY